MSTTIDLLLTRDKQTIETYFNTIRMYKLALQSRTVEMIVLKKMATRLIHFLKEQYHLK